MLGLILALSQIAAYFGRKYTYTIKRKIDPTY